MTGRSADRGPHVGHYSDSRGSDRLHRGAGSPGRDGVGGHPRRRSGDSGDRSCCRRTSSVGELHAVLLTGGSAPGLGAAAGVSTFLRERGYGYQTPYARIPLVTAAVIYDLGLGDARSLSRGRSTPTRPRRPPDGEVEEGSVGAGTGATVGKILGPDGRMKGGIGLATVRLGEAARRSGHWREGSP